MKVNVKKFISIFTINIFLFLVFVNTALALEFSNPLKNLGDSVPVLIGKVITILLGLVGSLSLVFFIWGGFMWMTAAGNSERVEKGKSTLLWAVIGLTAIFLSYAILSIIIETLTSGANFTQK